MANQKTIKFIKPWRLQVVGAIITVDSSVADLLVQSGRAEFEAIESKQEKKTKLPVIKQPTIRA